MGFIFVCKLKIIVIICLLLSYLTNETCFNEMRIKAIDPLLCSHQCSKLVECYGVMYDEVSLLCTLFLEDKLDSGNSNHSEKNNNQVQDDEGATVSSKEPHSRNTTAVVKENMVEPDYSSIKFSVKIHIKRKSSPRLNITDLLSIDDFLYVAERFNKILIKFAPCNNTFCEIATMKLGRYPVSLASFNTGGKLVVAQQGMRGKLSVIDLPSFTNLSFINLHEPYSFSYQQLSSFNNTSIIVGSSSGDGKIFILTFSGNNVVSWFRILWSLKFRSFAVSIDGDLIVMEFRKISCFRVVGRDVRFVWFLTLNYQGGDVVVDKYGYTFFNYDTFNAVYRFSNEELTFRQILTGVYIQSTRKTTALTVDQSGRVFVALTSFIQMFCW